MLKKNLMSMVTAMAVAMSLVLCGCGGNGTAQAPVSGTAHVASGTAGIRDEAVPTSGPAAEASDKNEAEESDTGKSDDYGTVEAISGLVGLKADVEDRNCEEYCTVYTDDEHNPYDVVWDYGRTYGKFVKAVGDAGRWDVLFDVDFYTENYPMLAKLYHDDEDLLLEHFQTVGVHEGRQGSEAFNVAAYMENCDQSLVKAFGDAYECYYFYWALNQDSEGGVDTQSDGHPLQMTVKLTSLQATELRKVNEYRAEVGAEPVTVHPEFLAFANYRAWCDFTGDYEGHDWFYANQDYLTRVLKGYGARKIGENTVYGETGSSGPSLHTYYRNYYNSPEHYKTMVNTDYAWFACSNTYWGNTGSGYRYCEYDMYLNAMDSYQVGVQ